MTFTEAAREVLRVSGRPLHYKEITELAIDQNLLSHVGKSPEVTMGARLAATLKKEGDSNDLIRVKPGVFALRDWDEATIKKGLEIKRAPRVNRNAASAKPAETEAKDEQAASSPENPPADNAQDSAEDAPAVAENDGPRSPDEEMRAEIAAAATAVYVAEDDDDEPIFKPAAEGGESPEGGRRRKRRRRRRGGGARSGSSSSDDSNGADGMPSYTATPAFDAQRSSGGGRGPQVIELAPTDAPPLDGLAGHDLATGVAAILTSFDRTVGAVSLRQIVETAQRRGKLSGDGQLAQSQIAAAVRADNARRLAAGHRPRFRLAGGRVGLSDWLLDGELARLERDAATAVRRYREGAQRAFVGKCAELPGHAFVELCLMVLECAGAGSFSQIRYPGASGAEAHFSATVHSPAGALAEKVCEGTGSKLAIVIRKDGRDIGRERVTELRGSAHHYDNATTGWILSSGQVLSGARDEVPGAGVMPVSLIDGQAIARLAEQHGVAVISTSHRVGLPDVDLFEALRSS